MLTHSADSIFDFFTGSNSRSVVKDPKRRLGINNCQHYMQCLSSVDIYSLDELTYHDRWGVLNPMVSTSAKAAVRWCRSSPLSAIFDCVSASSSCCRTQQSAASRASGSGGRSFKRFSRDFKLLCLVSYEVRKDNALTNHGSEEGEGRKPGA